MSFDTEFWFRRKGQRADSCNENSTLQAASCEMLKEVDAVYHQPFGYQKVYATYWWHRTTVLFKKLAACRGKKPMVFSSLFPPKDNPRVSLFELLFNQHVPYDENKKIFVDAADEERFFTFNDVKKHVLHISAGLTNAFGLQRKDVVAICSPNEVDFLSDERSNVY